MAVKSIPDGYHAVTPDLVVPGVAKRIDYLTRAIEAKEVRRRCRPDGTIMHAEIRFAGSAVMMGEPMGQFEPMPASIYLHVIDCDAVYQRALQAGGTSVMELTTMFHAGHRHFHRLSGHPAPSCHHRRISRLLRLLLDLPYPDRRHRAQSPLRQPGAAGRGRPSPRRSHDHPAGSTRPPA